ncbi:uncharacterized protein MAM_07577 [Metarhizium album ARSEF 1941]|uniref:Uncharacterized protein n=1 Tax=Metarhizium album (strain ARSEF 1941) TaxID=1081103 RepID=A0A0B2WM05_METAS|nr:uncharacterized protein MAM_07577 [Metarhizium album ARSEF 1941]KHN94522.1 hypothetical protein MAM_07577 [Metarhizium album ARSEF 1941]
MSKPLVQTMNVDKNKNVPSRRCNGQPQPRASHPACWRFCPGTQDASQCPLSLCPSDVRVTTDHDHGCFQPWADPIVGGRGGSSSTSSSSTSAKDGKPMYRE